jgi:hypothetical protein
MEQKKGRESSGVKSSALEFRSEGKVQKKSQDQGMKYEKNRLKGMTEAAYTDTD